MTPQKIIDFLMEHFGAKTDSISGKTISESRLNKEIKFYFKDKYTANLIRRIKNARIDSDGDIIFE